MKLLLPILGRLLAIMPVIIPQAICLFIGIACYYLLPKRRHTLLSNLHHAFPHKSIHWIKRIALSSCIRTMETGMLVLALPYLSKRRIKKNFQIDENIEKQFTNNKASVALIPHFSIMECSGLVPFLHSSKDLVFAAIYRPFKNKDLDQWIKNTREHFGGKLLSRKSGFIEAMKILRNGGNVALLFDQNAGRQGILSVFMNRICSSTNLGGLLATKFKTQVVMVYPRRKGFWKAKIHAELLETEKDPASITIEANAWLENKLRSDDEICADWLWMHSRWRNQDDHNMRFRLETKKNYLKEAVKYYSWKELPKNTRFWIRMPNWLGDIIMALPVIRAIKLARPDAEITLIAKKIYIPLIEQFNIADKTITLPEKGLSYYLEMLKHRHSYPDTHILFTNSTRGDMEARIIGSPQRFGMLRPGKTRSLLTRAWELPEDLDETQIHQTFVWEKFAQYFGLQETLDLSGFKIENAKSAGSKTIGMICGTENDPSKRWPIKHWRDLIKELIACGKADKILLFGTSNDMSITNEVAEGLAPEVSNLAGTTSLTEFAHAMTGCSKIICNDTGGMHLANALGIPVIAIYGPTNPIRTGPIFCGEKTIIQPEGCAPSGGEPIEKIHAGHIMPYV